MIVGDIKDELASKGGGADVEEFCDMSGEVFVVAESAQTTGTAELYHSRCTNHISPYQKKLQELPKHRPSPFLSH